MWVERNFEITAIFTEYSCREGVHKYDFSSCGSIEGDRRTEERDFRGKEMGKNRNNLLQESERTIFSYC